ncbi:MAG: tetratricopeptide repeat protein [Bacteroidetes bacterium]|nr:tetratricopeptide repeat protein [Bacteroidota bacterium]
MKLRQPRSRLHIVRVLFPLFLCASISFAQENTAYTRHLSSARELLRRNADSSATYARRAINEAKSPTAQAEARELYAEALRQAGDYTSAQVQYGLLMTYASRVGDAQLRGRALNGLGVIDRIFDNFDASMSHHSEAYRVFDSLGNQLGAAQAMHDLGVTLRNLGRDEEAMDIQVRALRLRNAENNKAAIAESHNSIGNLYWYAGQPDSALEQYRDALALRKQLGVLSVEVAATLTNIGNVYRTTGNPARALEFFRESLNISRTIGDEGMIAVTRKNMGIAFRQEGDFTRGREALNEALNIALRLRMGRVVADVLNEQSVLETQTGNHEEALILLRRHMAVQDSLRRLIGVERLRQAEEKYRTIRHQLKSIDAEDSRESDFQVFLLVVIVLLLVIVGIALSTLRMRDRTNRALSEKNAEIHTMNVQLQKLNYDLARSEEKYRLLFERLPVGVFLYDADMKLLQVNDAFADIIGSPRDRLEGFNFASLRDRRIIPALQAAIGGKPGAYEGEYLVSTNDNALQVSVRTAPVQYNDLPSAHGIGFVLEISNWKRVEHDLIESRELAVQADKLKNAFLSNISHEIRTPLNIIMGYFGILHQDLIGRIGDEEAEYFDKVDFAVRRLLRTVDQILTLSILESGSYRINVEQCHLYELVEEMCEELIPLAAGKGLNVQFVKSCRDVYINVDKYSVGQALRNLLDNAVKFTDVGEIRLSLRCSSSHISFIVQDTGIGMAEDYVKQLFEAFSQEDTGYSRTYEGLGLGLRLTKRYLEVNNGGILVESAKGEGTTFTVTFPVAHHFAHPAPAEQAADIPLPVIDVRHTLLVVEDDHETQKFLQLILSSSFDLYFADSADDAWDTLHEVAVDLVLMDISLRGDEDGLQLTGRIRQDPDLRGLPIIAVTAHAFADDRRRSLEAGCNEYLPKPFRVNQLRELVDRFLK